MNVIGEVNGHHCVLVDDIVDSAGTLVSAAVALMEAGAQSVSAYVTHGVLSKDAAGKVMAAPLENLVITDSIQATDTMRSAKNIRQISIAPLLGEAIQRIFDGTSVSNLFD